MNKPTNSQKEKNKETQIEDNKILKTQETCKETKRQNETKIRWAPNCSYESLCPNMEIPYGLSFVFTSFKKKF